jgi:hypothetical protein
MGILNDAVDLLAHPQTKTDSRLGEIMIDFRSIRNAVPASAVAAALFLPAVLSMVAMLRDLLQE